MAQASLIPGIFSRADTPNRKLLQFQRGEIIFRQGDVPDSIYFVVAGRVQLSVTDIAGNRAILAIVAANELFGHQCLILGRKTRMMTAEAVAASEVVKLPTETLSEFLERDTRLAKFILRDTIVRMTTYEDALVHQIINNTERRLARVLLQLSKYDGKRGRPKIIEGVSQESLAELVGATRPKVNGFMNKFRRLGHIDYSGDRIVVRPSLTSVLLQS